MSGPSPDSEGRSLDRRIADLTHALSLDPRSSRALLDRALAYGRKGDFDAALADLNVAIPLDPQNAYAHELRGLLRQRLGEYALASSDFETAALLDPASAARYAEHRSAGVLKTHGRETSAKAEKSKSRLGGFVKRIAQYYAEFLSTDFKKQRLPKRRLQNTDAQGRLVGIQLQKYPGFQQKLWTELSKPVGEGLKLSISRGNWRSALPKAIAEAAATHIALVEETQVTSVIDAVLTWATSFAMRGQADPEIGFEQFVERTRSALAQEVIAPLLDRMEQFFSRTEHKPLESMKELEDQISVLLTAGIERDGGAAFASLLVRTEEVELRALLRDQLAPPVVRKALQEFFASFAANDLYVELSDLVRSSRLIENADFYLHLGEVHFNRHVFPIFFIPFRAERTETGFDIEAEPRLYVNKRAMDYVAQELAKAEDRDAQPSVISERIFYLAPEQSVIGRAQKTFDAMAGGFNLRAAIDFREPRDQKTASVLVNANNRLSFSLFDRSDESLVNDYEAIAGEAEAGVEVVDFFQSLIDDFLLNNPVSIRSDVDREWESTPMTERLVFDSPLPLVEEQRKILSALRHPESRFIAVEGPPGTGKSHTITAVVFDLILSGKSLLILSDKKEALDVVDDKLHQALIKARPSQDFPHPILRLGRDASNYSKILRKSTISRLQVNQRHMRRKRDERDGALANERKALTGALTETAAAYAQIDVGEIAQFEKDAADLILAYPEAVGILANPVASAAARDCFALHSFIVSQPTLSAVLRWQGKTPARLIDLNGLTAVLANSAVSSSAFAGVVGFTRDRLEFLDRAIANVEDARMAVFGYLFAGKRLREISRELYERCKIECERPNADLPKLRALRSASRKLLAHLTANNLEQEFDSAATLVAANLAGAGIKELAPKDALNCASRLQGHVALPSHNELGFFAALTAEDGPFATMMAVGSLKVREAEIRAKFEAVPKMDYVGSKTKIESLNAQTLAERIDDRLLDFYDNKKNDAMALGKIIREKQRFPIEKFSDLQQAFPCIIAGLRDYAEFIPLERELFDLVIIDEASQVSIAQALPAMVRAKKVLVLGDKNQFGTCRMSSPLI